MTGVFRRADRDLVSALQAGSRKTSEVLFDDSGLGLDLDKAWHGLNWLLCGDAWGTGDKPEGLAIMGGVEFGEELGYGKARLLEPEQVQACAAALATISVADLEARFEPSAMQEDEVYPDIWDEGPGALEYLTSYFEPLRGFYSAAAEAGDHVLLAVV